jgi:predicted dehydrogenase
MHFELAKRALLSNKHVVVEKPFTVTSKEADELITLAEIQGKIVTAYQNRRWDSDFKTVRKVIKSGVLGNLVEYEAHFDRFRNYVKENAWREEELPGSGILYDLGGHLIDQAQYLFGLPEEIYADIRTQRKGGKTDDNFEIILYYNELKVVLKSGMLVKEPLPHFILLGDKGSFIKYGMDVQEEDLKAGKIPSAAKNWGKEPKELWGSIQTEVNGLHIEGKVQSEVGDYRAFYQNVYEAITEDAVLKVTPQQARNTIKIIELAIESSKNKCAVKWDTTV